MSRGPSRCLAVALSTALALPIPAQAHNEPVHQAMTDYAYHVILAGERFAQGGPMSARLRAALRNLERANPGLTKLFADAAAAAPKLRALASGLPLDTTPCISPALVALWRPGARLAAAVGNDARCAADAPGAPAGHGPLGPWCGGVRDRRVLCAERRARVRQPGDARDARSHRQHARVLVGSPRQGDQGRGASLDHARGAAEPRWCSPASARA